jgi:hypothetical protein
LTYLALRETYAAIWNQAFGAGRIVKCPISFIRIQQSGLGTLAFRLLDLEYEYSTRASFAVVAPTIPDVNASTVRRKCCRAKFPAA